MKTVKGLKIAALVPLGWMTAVLLLFAVDETVGGDSSGLGHLIPVLFIELVMWLGWQRPLWAGVFLLAGAVFYMLRFLPGMLDQPGAWSGPILIMVLALALSGTLLLPAVWAGRKTV